MAFKVLHESGIGPRIIVELCRLVKGLVKGLAPDVVVSNSLKALKQTMQRSVRGLHGLSRTRDGELIASETLLGPRSGFRKDA